MLLTVEFRIRHNRDSQLSQFRSEDPAIRTRAINALQELAVRWHGYDRRILDALKQTIQTDSSSDVVGSAVFTLKATGGSEIPSVRDFYKDLFAHGDERRKYVAACQLFEQDPDMLAYMTSQFPSQDASTRHGLILGLSMTITDIGGDFEAGQLEPLFALGLKDQESRVRSAAAVGLHTIGTPTAVQALIERLSFETDVGVRFTLKGLLGYEIEPRQQPEPLQT